jgi:hypothetical protein
MPASMKRSPAAVDPSTSGVIFYSLLDLLVFLSVADPFL